MSISLTKAHTENDEKNITSMEALMNIRKLLLLPLIALSINTYGVHVPIQGPLDLTDPIGQIGAITATLRTSPDLQTEARQIAQFVQSLNMGPLPYQRIIDHVTISHAPQAFLALEAYAKTVMYMYQNEAYMLKVKSAPLLFPIRGIKNPFGNEARLNQLLNEYDQLATIAMKKNYMVGSRMKLTVKCYKNWYWKSCLAIAAGAYILYDIGQRDQKNTILYGLCRMNLKPIFRNISADLSGKIGALRTSSTSTDMPMSTEKAVISLMAAKEATKDKLLSKEVLSVMRYKEAIKAQELAKIAAQDAIAAQKEVVELQGDLEEQEIQAQKFLGDYCQQRQPNPAHLAVDNQEKNNNLIEQADDYNSFCEKIMSIPTTIIESAYNDAQILKQACEKIAPVLTNGYNYAKELANAYRDPENPNATSK